MGQLFLGIALLSSISNLLMTNQVWLKRSVLGVMVSVGGAFILLAQAHVTSDFSYLNVVEHSHTAQPLIYKIVGVWGNHEGSMLLWVLLLSITSFGASNTLPSAIAMPVGRILSFILLGFIVFLMIACDPFAVVAHIPTEGADLNPLLQDPSLVIHPPFLYAGYVSCAVPFALALVAMVQKSPTIDWAPLMRRWSLIAWVFLTIGLALGSYWAYYELGWGGWWFWDPVENSALMPWLACTALFHSLHVTIKTGGLGRCSLVFGIVTFGLCLLSVSFVRSGLLVSVHSFAFDPERGLLLFGLTAVIVLPALGLWIKSFSGLSQQGTVGQARFISLGMILFACGLVAIAASIVYPLIMDQLGQAVSIGPSYFHVTFLPLVIPVSVLMGMVVLGQNFTVSFEKIIPSISAGCFGCLLAYWTLSTVSVLGIVSVGASFFLIVSMALYSRKPALMLAHVGLGLAVIGAVFSSYGEKEQDITLKVGERCFFKGYSVQLESYDTIAGPNYTAMRSVLKIYDSNDKVVSLLKPETRYYWTQDVTCNETAIYTSLFSQLHATYRQGPLIEDNWGRVSFRLQHKPFINLLWCGIGLMVIGGIVAIFLMLIKTR
ncbi:MAG: cytochrome c biogenesis protein CcsA [Alphaproteobacteria bacterium]|nr:cytochrome c biogenesis protein CcsA [Alphaproteobacteria bacterium]